MNVRLQMFSSLTVKNNNVLLAILLNKKYFLTKSQQKTQYKLNEIHAD